MWLLWKTFFSIRASFNTCHTELIGDVLIFFEFPKMIQIVSLWCCLMIFNKIKVERMFKSSFSWTWKKNFSPFWWQNLVLTYCADKWSQFWRRNGEIWWTHSHSVNSSAVAHHFQTSKTMVGKCRGRERGHFYSFQIFSSNTEI